MKSQKFFVSLFNLTYHKKGHFIIIPFAYLTSMASLSKAQIIFTRLKTKVVGWDDT